ncbi:HD domain-containing phosphohydrolase [Vibrio nitrifigilis]|uniref:HD domain-containing protein n=2 Tax=Vibrio nitrifigilis TaxID=2789781 RepID=A0ABS0GL12_9VIBR|nr:HD domain-containing phosphohydrolase [Vibrio nitrifigilis]MBF9003164.1 HD domain-containing protein [Vibrio nitrifigilis]
MKKHRYSLSIHISSLFLVLTSLIGIVLITISYQHSQHLLMGSAKAVSEENSQKLQSAFQKTTAPIFSALDFMAHSRFVETESPIYDKPFWLSAIETTFKRNPHLVALYFGANNGDFTMLRPLFTEQERKRFNAPDTASLFVNRTKVDGTNDVYFFNSQQQEVGFRKSLDNQFDPRKRPWYTSAQMDGEIRLTEPYFFYFLQTFGVTLSRTSMSGSHVVGADFTLESLSSSLNKMKGTEHSKLVLFDNQFSLLGQHNTALNIKEHNTQLEKHLANSVFASVVNRISNNTIYENVQFEAEEWSVTLTPVFLSQHVQLRLAEADRHKDLLKDLISMRDKQITIAIILLLVCFGFVWFISQRIARPLKHLVELTDNIARFDFKKTRYPKTMIKELGNLTQSIQLMEHTLYDLLRLLRDTASNHEFDVLAKTIAQKSYMITKAETIILYVYDYSQNEFSVVTNHAIIPFKIDLNRLLADTPWLLAELRQGNTVHVNRDDNMLRKYRDQMYNSDIYLFPLLNREGQLVGVLNLGYERAISDDQKDKHAFLRELLSFAEIAKDNIDRIQQQKDMLNAFVELIASSIDTKSPYTGGHCQRVPELANMMAHAIEEDKQYFPHFTMSKAQWESLHLAAWLHDCGKVTTPEYVIDKATKLETIYDRIHEVRMRFELLKKQAECDYWQGLAQGGEESQLRVVMQQTQHTLDEEFAFVAKCNLGSENMSQDDVKRLNKIAQREWQRTLDDTLGVSWIEAARAGQAQQTPVMEPLLCDKAVHLIPWVNGNRPQDVWQHDFILKPGNVRYNRGELHNLSVRSGTLTDEERFIINDHIVQTITMLEKLPYPPHLKSVPDIAGNHHERVDGKGYPRGLDEDHLSVEARIMAIADVFEALTSSDRPYKKAKTLSESLNIMTTMAMSGHLDPKLYLLFLEHEIYLEYASSFLDEEQCDHINKQTHIKEVKDFLKAQY